jgi:hypothetical protein
MMHRYPTRLQSRLAKAPPAPRLSQLYSVEAGVLHAIASLTKQLQHTPLRDKIGVVIKIWRILASNETLVLEMHARKPSIVLGRIQHFRERRLEIQEESEAIERALYELGDVCLAARARLVSAWSDRMQALSDFPALEVLLKRVEAMCA